MNLGGFSSLILLPSHSPPLGSTTPSVRGKEPWGNNLYLRRLHVTVFHGVRKTSGPDDDNRWDTDHYERHEWRIRYLGLPRTWSKRL